MLRVRLSEPYLLLERLRSTRSAARATSRAASVKLDGLGFGDRNKPWWECDRKSEWVLLVPVCSQPQSWPHSHSHSQSTTRNHDPLSDFNRIGRYSETWSDLDALPLSSTSFFGSQSLTRTVLVPVLAPLYFVFHLATRYILGLATLLPLNSIYCYPGPRYPPRSSLYLGPRSSVLATLGQPILGKLRLPIMSRSSLTFLGELVSR